MTDNIPFFAEMWRARISRSNRPLIAHQDNLGMWTFTIEMAIAPTDNIKARNAAELSPKKPVTVTRTPPKNGQDRKPLNQ